MAHTKTLENESFADSRRESAKLCATSVLNQLPRRSSLEPPAQAQIRPLEGFLWKKKVVSTPLKRWAKRFFVVSDGKLFWYKVGNIESGKDIDFSINPCKVKYVVSSETQFILYPHHGEWLFEGHGGVREGSEILLDAADSEHSRQTWRKVIEQHVKHS